MSIVHIFLIAIVSYILGCFNGSVAISKYVLHDDVRTHGSKNGGLTNTYRTFGPKVAIFVFSIDLIKGIIAILIASSVANNEYLLYAQYWAALFCLLGHMFPVFFEFHGGKGILTGCAIVFSIDWRMGIGLVVTFIICFVLTRYVSLGSCCGALVFFFETLVIYFEVIPVVLSFLIVSLIIWMHRGNIRRIKNGTESKFHFHRDRMENHYS